jgi:hypothetical protein
MSTINPTGKEIVSVSTEFCGQTLTLEVNRVGFRTTASVLVQLRRHSRAWYNPWLARDLIKLDYFPLSMSTTKKKCMQPAKSVAAASSNEKAARVTKPY